MAKEKIFTLTLKPFSEVETSDHACLRITYAAQYNFQYTVGDEDSERKIFAAPDYIGFATRFIGSRIRAMAARTCFDVFHRNSTTMVWYGMVYYTVPGFALFAHSSHLSFLPLTLASRTYGTV